MRACESVRAERPTSRCDSAQAAADRSSNSEKSGLPSRVLTNPVLAQGSGRWGVRSLVLAFRRKRRAAKARNGTNAPALPPLAGPDVKARDTGLPAARSADARR